MYWLITIIRNFLFDRKIIKAKSYKDIFVLCIGNLRVGGTGKTPMIEFLIRNLKEEYPLAVVSLGYKRKTKGLKEVTLSDTALSVGDEPRQMKKKFPMIPIFVNKNRNIAIDYIRKNYPNIKLILLDDAYQYRKTIPNKTILLTEYNRPYFKDFIIPYGRLREQRNEMKRADYIVVTKIDTDISKQEKDNFIKKINPLPNQKVFFSQIEYNLTPKIQNTSYILFVAGIDNPKPAMEYLQSLNKDVVLKKYPDHYAFKKSDIENIKKIAGTKRLVVTTEKDAMRLKDKNLQFEVLRIENKIDNSFINIIKESVYNSNN